MEDGKYRKVFRNRSFLCTKSFESEGRYCKEGETYTAFFNGVDSYKFVFENGDMNFTIELFERVAEAWKDVIVETTD